MQECDRMEALVTEVQATTKLAIRSRTGSEFVHCGMRFGPHLGCYPTRVRGVSIFLPRCTRRSHGSTSPCAVARCCRERAQPRP